METGYRERTTTVTEKRNETLDMEFGLKCKELSTAVNQVGMALWLIRKCGSAEAAKIAVEHAAEAVSKTQSSSVMTRQW